METYTMKLALLAFMLLAQTLPCGQAIAAEGTLARVNETRQIRMGYFEGSAPFSSTGTDKSPQGYSIELCERVAAESAATRTSSTQNGVGPARLQVASRRYAAAASTSSAAPRPGRSHSNWLTSA
jgi:ABC-type amino acid transport substrate-binding protein